MTGTAPTDHRMETVVLAPLAGDAQTLLDLLRSNAIAGRRAELLEDLGRFDLLIVAEEALTRQMVDALAAFLADQPSWSTPPIVILLDDEAMVGPLVSRLQAVRPGYTPTVLQKPATPTEVLSAVRTALAARSLQIQVRDLLAQYQQAQQRADFLLKELGHRVKNLYASILALAAETARRTPGDSEAFLTVFRGRVMTLSHAADVLAENAWQAADLSHLVDRIVSPVVPDRSRFSVAADCPAVELPPRIANTLGMVLHELATNAIKYGSLSVPDGMVRIAWRSVEDGTVTIEWQETGGPAVVEPKTKGFGTIFIERSIALEANGSATFHYCPEGLRCEIALSVQ